MNEKQTVDQSQTSGPKARTATREQQGELLRQKEAELGRLAAEQKKEEFFRQITPLLGPLKSYLKRRLRVAYLDLDIRVPVQSSGDILEGVILRAYENYQKKPQELTLEQWLYQLANKKLDNYIRKKRAQDARRRSLEDLRKEELAALEERMTTDAESELYLEDDIMENEDYSDYLPDLQRRNFTPPADQSNPEEELEKREELQQIVQALSRVPPKERIVFELYGVEGFSKEETAKISNTPADEVPRIADKVRAQIYREIEGEAGKKAS